MQTPTASESDEGMRPGLDPVTPCAKVLKGLKLPYDADIPLWFDEFERLFVTTVNGSRVEFIYLYRPSRNGVKKAVLLELTLCPAEYLDQFAKAAKRNDKTWKQFASRVGTQLDYYLKSRKVKTKGEIGALMVAYRTKNSLSAKGLKYVCLRKAEAWLKPPQIANVLQDFEQAKRRGFSLICAVTNNLDEGLDCLLSREDWELLTKCHPNGEANSKAETFASSSGDREVGTVAMSEPAAAMWDIAEETAPEAPAEDIDEAVQVDGPRARLLASQLADDSPNKVSALATTPTRSQAHLIMWSSGGRRVISLDVVSL
ncbi:hypothetical protein HPB48_017566 [Haemaphysalis longicornis]|uniref:Uncharacterized protein n=1 Tax=Haemaphysalis longicornis TaxID=44386 RepID=A0A9J6GTG3_HAELO|nr:hypothetical protein HPB48_017566 [Haemaphysalis longicornis]